MIKTKTNHKKNATEGNTMQEQENFKNYAINLRDIREDIASIKQEQDITKKNSKNAKVFLKVKNTIAETKKSLEGLEDIPSSTEDVEEIFQKVDQKNREGKQDEKFKKILRPIQEVQYPNSRISTKSVQRKRRQDITKERTDELQDFPCD